MRTLASLAATILAGCVATGAAAAGRADFTLVFLETNPAQPALTVDEVSAAMRGHFENMGRLADEGLLLVAGPLGPPRADPDHRGIFVFDVPEVERALELAASDPAVRAGIFVVDAFPLRTTVALRGVVERDEALQAERLAQEPGGPEWVGRSFVIVTTPDAAAAERALQPLLREDRVLMLGQLGGARQGELFFVLDAESAEAARELLARADEHAGTTLAWTLHPWYATAAVAELVARG